MNSMFIVAGNGTARVRALPNVGFYVERFVDGFGWRGSAFGAQPCAKRALQDAGLIPSTPLELERYRKQMKAMINKALFQPVSGATFQPA